MRCPYCFGEETKVMDKRDSEGVTRRRRECTKCNKRFTTYERVEKSIIIIKKDGRKEEFDREKVKMGITKACTNRPISEEAMENIIDEVEAKLLKLGKKEIDSRIIGDLVLKKLLKLDKVAYIRFASVYRSFETPKEFEKEIKLVKG